MENLYTIRINQDSTQYIEAVTFFINDVYDQNTKKHHAQLNIMQHLSPTDTTVDKDFDFPDIQNIEILLQGDVIYTSNKWTNFIGTNTTYNIEEGVFVKQLMFSNIGVVMENDEETVQ